MRREAAACRPTIRSGQQQLPRPRSRTGRLVAGSPDHRTAGGGVDEGGEAVGERCAQRAFRTRLDGTSASRPRVDPAAAGSHGGANAFVAQRRRARTVQPSARTARPLTALRNQRGRWNAGAPGAASVSRPSRPSPSPADSRRHLASTSRGRSTIRRQPGIVVRAPLADRAPGSVTGDVHLRALANSGACAGVAFADEVTGPRAGVARCVASPEEQVPGARPQQRPRRSRRFTERYVTSCSLQAVNSRGSLPAACRTVCGPGRGGGTRPRLERLCVTDR
jgi:hypothetical protein